MKRKRFSIGTRLMTAGLVLILSALALTAYNLWDMERAAESAVEVLLELTPRIPAPVPAQPYPVGAPRPAESAPETEIPDYILAPKMDMPEQTVNGTAYIGTLEIPALGLRLPVASSWDYKLLKTSPCRYSGSVYTNDLVIAAHNYRSHFGQLTSLSVDSEILFTDVDGNMFRYAIAEFETLEPTAIEEMTSGAPGLTLFTCTVGGKSRIAVRAGHVENE